MQDASTAELAHLAAEDGIDVRAVDLGGREKCDLRTRVGGREDVVTAQGFRQSQKIVCDDF